MIEFIYLAGVLYTLGRIHKGRKDASWLDATIATLVIIVAWPYILGTIHED